jgi:hypothetical protein
MSYQYNFCPTCGTRRVAYAYRCSVCDGLVRRAPVRIHVEPSVARRLLNVRSNEAVEVVPAEMEPVAA